VTRSRLLTFAALLGSLALGAITRPALLRLGQSRPRFIYACVPLAPASYDALAARPGWLKTTETVTPGVALNGLLRRPSRADAPWVLFFPGNDESQLTEGQAFLERLRGDRDWGLAVYAYRGYDSSGGKPSTASLTEDGFRILADLVSRERLDPARLHVVAFSLGGYVAAGAVGKAARAGTRVRSLSTLAAAADMEMGRSVWQQRFVLGDVVNTLPLLDDVPEPVLVLHGSADESLPVEQGRTIAARLGSRARFKELPGVGHLDIAKNPEAVEAVRAVIESAEVARAPAR
jgi:fermentation-respiration switch protein FrsA (DUF1100 family)